MSDENLNSVVIDEDNDYDLLGKSVLFHQLTPIEFEKISKLFSFKNVKKGDYIYRQGDVFDTTSVIISGKVKMVHLTNGGNVNITAVHGNPQVLGGLSVFNIPVMPDSAIALTDTRIAEANRVQLMDWLRHDAKSRAFIQNYVATESVKLNMKYIDFMFSDIPTRVAKVLVDLAAKFGTTEADGRIDINHHLTQHELSQLVGSSRETVNKVLSDFDTRCWIVTGNKKITVLDMPRLTKRANQ